MPDGDFAPLVAPHLPAMLRVARVIVGADDAEDVAQDALTSAWRRRDDLRDPAAVRAWLLRITVNTCHNWLRARNTPTGRYALSLDVEEAPLVDGAPGHDPGASDHGSRLDLRLALASLDRESQRLIGLRYFAGLDSSEIGAALDTPAATIRTRLRRALSLLRQALDGPRPEPGALTTATPEKGNTDV